MGELKMTMAVYEARNDNSIMILGVMRFFKITLSIAYTEYRSIIFGVYNGSFKRRAGVCKNILSREPFHGT
jgi:hypothetical protein